MKKVIIRILISVLLMILGIYISKAQGKDSLALAIKLQKVDYMPRANYYDYFIAHVQDAFTRAVIFTKYIKGGKLVAIKTKKDSISSSNNYLIRIGNQFKVIEMPSEKGRHDIIVNNYYDFLNHEFYKYRKGLSYNKSMNDSLIVDFVIKDVIRTATAEQLEVFGHAKVEMK